MGKLTANMLRGSLEPGRHHDGDGLFLNVTPTGARSWICRVQKNGRRRDIELGSAKKVSLAQARQRAAEVRSQVEAGIDPVLQRKKAEGIPTFREAAAKVFNENSKGWKNKKHRDQWLNSLEAYAFPKIGDIAVSDIESSHIRDVLIAIWLDKNETARRVRQRIAMVIDWAIAKNYRAHPLPMTALNKSLPKLRKRKSHHRALPYAQVPGFMTILRERESIGRLAFEFLILTAARSGEVRGALWSEINLKERTWTIPAARMKADQEHVIPLSDAALTVLKTAKVHKQKDSDLVFPGARRDKPMSDMTLTKICRDAEVEAVPHGFRSSFRDWVSEETDFDGDIAEMALAHTIANPVEAAYRRGNLLQKRRKMMDEWALYCRVDVRRAK